MKLAEYYFKDPNSSLSDPITGNQLHKVCFKSVWNWDSRHLWCERTEGNSENNVTENSEQRHRAV